MAASAYPQEELTDRTTRRRAWMTRTTGMLLFAVAALVALPTIAHAQSAMTGIVKDTSGAVLPGVTVEAASDVLIEKSQVAVTDGEGRYRIVDLRPGTYVVTFTLPGSRRSGARASICRPSSPPDDQRRAAGRRARGVDHGDRRRPDRRRDDRRAHAGARTATRSTRFRPAAPSRAWAS